MGGGWQVAVARLVVVERGGSTGYIRLLVAGGAAAGAAGAEADGEAGAEAGKAAEGAGGGRWAAGRGGAARRRCVLLRLALALWRGQLYRLADACARELVIY